MRYKAVAFDVDGTLYPNASMYLNSIPFVLSRLRFMRAYARVRSEIRRRRPIDDFSALEARMLGDELGITPAEARDRIAREIYGRWERVLDRVRLYPGVRECVERIRASGRSVAVSSDFPVEAKLRRIGMDGLFSCRLWTEESGYLKPHPEPFHMLAECLGEAPADILYVGNSYEYDIVGAKNAGLHAAHLTQKPIAGTVADFTFREYGALCDYVLNGS